MRRSCFLLLGILVAPLIVSVGTAQATPSQGKPFAYHVNMAKNGWATSSLPWLREWNIGPSMPIGWWPTSPYYADRGLAPPPDPPGFPFPPAEYWTDDERFCCHQDWNMTCAMYSGYFRYQVWIYWSDNPSVNPTARNIGGEFTFSEGTGDFADMSASGKAWVGHWAGPPIQHHVGMVTNPPE